MTSSGIGRHNSKPILEWDDVELDDAEGGSQQVASPQAQGSSVPAESRSDASAPAAKDKGASPWSSMRKLFKR